MVCLRICVWGVIFALVAAGTSRATSAVSAAQPGPESSTDGSASRQDEWNQWRGPQRTGFVADGAAWPDSLGEQSLVQKWRQPLGPSYSGPVVSGGNVFVTETLNGKTEHVRAYNRQTGELSWEQSWPGSLSVPFFAKSNGDWIRSTPALDDDSIYVAGIRDLLVCLSTKTGEIRWKVDFVEEFKSPLPTFGFVSSPLVEGDSVYVQAAGGFVRLNKKTGKVIWRVLNDGGGMNGSAFSSPFEGVVGGRRQMLVQGREKLNGVNPDTGEILWSSAIPAFRGMNIVTPTVFEDTIFTSSYGGGSLLLKPPPGANPADGTKPAGEGQDAITPTTVWKNKLQGYMSSPIVIDGHLYVHLRNQRFACIDLASGRETWVTTPFGKYWSIVAQGNRMLALDETGDLRLIRANPAKYEELSARHITDESTWAHLAVDGGQVFVRDLKGLTTFDWARK